MKGGGNAQIGFSRIIESNLGEKIKDINERLKRLCNSKSFLFIDSCNIDKNSLNKSLLNLSRCGNRLFSGTLTNALRGF